MIQPFYVLDNGDVINLSQICSMSSGEKGQPLIVSMANSEEYKINNEAEKDKFRSLINIHINAMHQLYLDITGKGNQIVKPQKSGLIL